MVGYAIASIARDFGNKFNIYDIDGSFLGVENGFVTSIKRSVDEYIASFRRTAFFCKDSKVNYGCIIEDIKKGEKFFVRSSHSSMVSSSIVAFYGFLIEINCLMNVYRKKISFVDETGLAHFEIKKIYSKIPAYLEKKDWTMENIVTYGRSEKAYETIICQDLSLRKDEYKGIQRGDYLKIMNKIYIVQDINFVLRERMLQIQGGLDTHININD